MMIIAAYKYSRRTPCFESLIISATYRLGEASKSSDLIGKRSANTSSLVMTKKIVCRDFNQ
jgi:hypothetical protein